MTPASSAGCQSCCACSNVQIASRCCGSTGIISVVSSRSIALTNASLLAEISAADAGAS